MISLLTETPQNKNRPNSWDGFYIYHKELATLLLQGNLALLQIDLFR